MDGKTKGGGSREIADGGLGAVNLTKEAQLTHKTKWELFLEGYRNYFNAEFSWPAYIKECKLYYGEFNIHDFIRTYGPDCEEDFKRFRKRILEQKGINRPVSWDGDAPVDASLLEMMVNGDSLRTRMLIRFLTPQTRAEKKNMKRSWKSAKKMGFSKREWLKSYVGLPFRVGKPDQLDAKYTREEIFALITDAKKKLDEIRGSGGAAKEREARPARPRADEPLARRPAEEPVGPRREQPRLRRGGEVPEEPLPPAPKPQTTDTIELSVPAPAEARPEPESAYPRRPKRIEQGERAERAQDAYLPRAKHAAPQPPARVDRAPDPFPEPDPFPRLDEPEANGSARTAYADPFASGAARGSAAAADAGFAGLSEFRPTEKFSPDEHFDLPWPKEPPRPSEFPPRTITATPEPRADAAPKFPEYRPETDSAFPGPDQEFPREAYSVDDPFGANDPGEPQSRARPLTPGEFLRDYGRDQQEPRGRTGALPVSELRSQPREPEPKPAPAAAMSAALRFEQHVDEQTRAVKRDNVRVTQELRRVAEITQSERERYEALREKRRRLTEELAQAARTAGMAGAREAD